MRKTLIDALKNIEDHRSARGRRYPLWLMLLLVIFGTLSECYGYQALEDFCARHYQVLAQQLNIPLSRLPSDSTFRRLFEQLDFQRLAQCFNQWAIESLTIEDRQWLGIDGKSIKGTVQGYNQGYQNFVSLVSVYSHTQGVTVALSQFQNAKTSEIKVVETLLQQLHLQGVIFTFDALHCQKKPCS